MLVICDAVQCCAAAHCLHNVHVVGLQDPEIGHQQTALPAFAPIAEPRSVDLNAPQLLDDHVIGRFCRSDNGAETLLLRGAS